MDIENKAQEYALNVLDECINKVKQAYIDGYNAGKAECPSIPQNITEDGVTYIDLSLPSGTLWSMPLRDKDGRNLLWLPFNKVKDLELPTEADYEELKKYTKTCLNGNSDYEYLSVDGVRYIILNYVTFWLKDKKDEMNAKCVDRKYASHISSTFIGESNCVVLVKRKK